MQEDIKKLIAYSSVAHMGFVTMGLFALNPQGVQGAMFQMVSHGLVSGALFLCVGVVYDRMHTREIAAYGGLVKRMPLYAVAFMIFTMANVGLPGTSGFVGEFLTLIGAFDANSWVALFATTGVILSAAYALYLYRRVIFGELDKASLASIADLSPREIAIFVPLLALTIYYGVHPGPILDASAASVAESAQLPFGAASRGSQSPPPANDGSVKMPFFTQLAHHFLPEVILAVGVLALILIGAFRGESSFSLVTELAVAVLGLALLAILLSTKCRGVVFDGAFIDDAFARFMKVLALGGSLVTILMSSDFLRRAALDKFEYPILIVLATLGMLMLISANNLIALYLGLELMSLALYVVAAFSRDDARASEAGLKYFVLGALSSGMLLYGASLLYGFAGTVSFPASPRRSATRRRIGVIFGLVFVLAGLAFKMSVVPFHMWTPDVYEGAPTPVTAFFASAPKMAAVAITARDHHYGFPGRDRPMAADHRLPRSRLDGAWLLRGDRPDQYQAADGLFRRSATWASRWSASPPAPRPASEASPFISPSIWS